jgi:hypothetical protein
MQQRLAVAVGLLAALLLNACAGTPRPGPSPRVPEPEPRALPVVLQPTPVAEQMRNKADVRPVIIGDGAVQPPVLEGQVGRPLRLHVINRSNRQQNFLIPDFGIAGRPLLPGEENYIEFTPSRSGRYPFFSQVRGRVQWQGSLLVR